MTKPNVPLFFLFILAALGVLVNPAHAALETGQKFKAWTVQCEQDAASKAEVCHIYQTAASKDGKNQLLRLGIGYPGNQGKPVVIILAPLGIALQAGIAFRVDGGEPGRIPLETCFPNGCTSAVELDDKLLAAFKNGVTAEFQYVDVVRGPVTASISLNGFSAGFAALK